MADKKSYNSLDDIFEDEDFHLIEEKKKQSSARTADERLIDSFEEIQEFVKEHNREPKPDTTNISEYQLYSRLKGIREDGQKATQLKEHDDHNLLPNIEANEPESESYKAPKKPESLDDILEDEDLGLISGEDEGLFDFKHVPKEDQRASADFVARRKPCKNFEKYEPLFRKVQKELSEGKRKLVEFSKDNLREGDFYVHNGILLYLEHVNLEEQKVDYDSVKIREDGRTKVIFENGTESNMLYWSLYKALIQNGKAVTKNFDEVNEEFIENFSNITEEDEEAGYIYVLKSKSSDKKIASIDNLYKIGYTENEISERLRNADKKPTYLMAEVEYVAGWKCYNMNTQKFEQLIQNFFGNTCLEVDVFDEKGRRYTPREWFIAPLSAIETAVKLIISGDVVDYRYDPNNKAIVQR
ncbi:GIY-YIG nuclease family protein [Gracilimonas sp. Q87]|uniref:GIY-YIG nuclease family protein n=1 Tax=Gracilimonas sp. Q87 TaxID=3384766 RepID=UPI003983E49B